MNLIHQDIINTFGCVKGSRWSRGRKEQRRFMEGDICRHKATTNSGRITPITLLNPRIPGTIHLRDLGSSFVTVGCTSRVKQKDFWVNKKQGVGRKQSRVRSATIENRGGHTIDKKTRSSSKQQSSKTTKSKLKNPTLN